MTRHPTLLPLLLCTVLLSTLADAQQPEPYRHLRGTPTPLTLDGTRIAVRTSSPREGESLIGLAAELGVRMTTVQATGAPQWFLVTLARPLEGRADTERCIGLLLRSAQIGFAGPVFRGSDGHWATVTPTVLLQFTAASTTHARVRELAGADGERATPFGGMRAAFAFASTARSGFAVLDQANRLAATPGVAWAEPDWLFSGSSHLVPNDPGWGNLWGMLNTGQFSGTPGMDMDADLAWDITTGSATVSVLVLDTGVQQNHPDINQRPGTDTTGQSGGGGPVNACDNHGTAVAGCVSALLNNNLGTVGIAPTCRSLSARCFISTSSCNGSWTSMASWTVNALEFGRVQGARVSNNSNGYGFTSSAIEAKYAATLAGGMLHFASAGNNSSSQATYPATLSTVFAVAALNSTGALASFSNFGSSIEYAAPGQNVYTTDRTGTDGWTNNDYTFANGTSFASPYCAGVAALVLSLHPEMTATQVALALRACRDIGATGKDNRYGWGFVNANAALRCRPYGAGLPGTGNLTPELFAHGLPRLGQAIAIRVEQARSNGVAV
ncbi:MAG: S8 family serine peptidase, partial [Planctomycetes bacterium]|nr:S8 family serine peptidase [Planctomycetota bacterium]